MTMAVTELKPDLVIVNDQKKTVDIFELTVPFEHNITTRHTFKSNKYAHFSKDITSHKTKITAFEVGSRGYLTPENEKRLRMICSFCVKILIMIIWGMFELLFLVLSVLTKCS